MFVMPLPSSSVLVPAPTPVAVTLTGATITSVSSGTATAMLLIIVDGELWKMTNAGSDQLDVATDWIIPNTDADSSYEVRYINHTGDELVQFGDISIEGTWVDLGTSRSLSVFVSNEEISKSATFDLQIRKDGGAVLATASFTLSANRFF